MFLFELQLLEAVLPYQMKWTNAASFKYSNNRTMIMKVESGRKGPGNFEVSFYPADKEGKDMYGADDAKGDEMSIFYTVMDFVEKWYLKNKSEVNSIYAEPSINDKYTGKRHRLYTTLANRMAKKYGGNVQTDGRFVNWYSPKDGEQAEATQPFIKTLQSLLTSPDFWEELSDEGSIEREDGEMTFQIDDANLNGQIVQFDADDSQPEFGSFTIAVDSDAYHDYNDNGDEAGFKAKLMSDLKAIANMVKTS